MSPSFFVIYLPLLIRINYYVMKKIVLLSAILTAIFTGCGNNDLVITPQVIKLGNVAENDSVHFSFSIRNSSHQTQSLDIMPECECTVVNTEHVLLQPETKTRISGSVFIDVTDDFNKYIYIDAADGSFFYTVQLTGRSCKK